MRRLHGPQFEYDLSQSVVFAFDGNYTVRRVRTTPKVVKRATAKLQFHCARSLESIRGFGAAAQMPREKVANRDDPTIFVN